MFAVRGSGESRLGGRVNNALTAEAVVLGVAAVAIGWLRRRASHCCCCGGGEPSFAACTLCLLVGVLTGGAVDVLGCFTSGLVRSRTNL